MISVSRKCRGFTSVLISCWTIAVLSSSVHAKDKDVTTFQIKLESTFPNDRIKIDALLYAYRLMNRPIDLTPTLSYQDLVNILLTSAHDSPDGLFISPQNQEHLEELGVFRKNVFDRNGKIVSWNLVIDPKAKAAMRIKSASVLASNGHLLIEAYQQLRTQAGFQPEEQKFLGAIEQTARQILRYPDENRDGRFGWGRVWFKGKDGLLLHSSDAANSMLFGGYTYFPRTDGFGSVTCQKAPPLAEETFDNAHIVIFLLDAWLVTRDHELADQILFTVGRVLDDSFDEGAVYPGFEREGWVYWKQLRRDDGRYQKCEVGRIVKNTNLRMATALLAYAEILEHNRDILKKIPELQNYSAQKYRDRALQIIAYNNAQILVENNFGYQGLQSRKAELTQSSMSSGVLTYDRTQKTISVDDQRLKELTKIIDRGNRNFGQPLPSSVTLCSGGEGTPDSDQDIAGSCWNHLPFEAEDYFALFRWTNTWGNVKNIQASTMIDAMTRNLAASKILLNGQNNIYRSYFPETNEHSVSNGIVNAAYYGFFCLARKVPTFAKEQISESEQSFLMSMDGVCQALPPNDAMTGVTWEKGYKFFEIYLEADRFSIPPEDWFFGRKIEVHK